MSLPRAVQLTEEIRQACGFGFSLTEPPFHFTKIFSLFSREERRTLLAEALRFMRGIERGRFTPFQFVAYYILKPLEKEAEYLSSLREKQELDSAETKRLKRLDTWPSGPASVKSEDLSQREISWVQDVLEGNDYKGLSRVLCRTLIPDYENAFDADDELAARKLASILRQPVKSADLAAAIATCLTQNQRVASIYCEESEGKIAEARLLPRDEFQEPYQVLDDDFIDGYDESEYAYTKPTLDAAIKELRDVLFFLAFRRF